MTFSKHIRWTIVEKYLEGPTVRVIAKHLGVSKSSVSRILKHFRKYGCIKKLPALLGKLRLLNLDYIAYFKALLNEKPDWYLYELHIILNAALTNVDKILVVWNYNSNYFVFNPVNKFSIIPIFFLLTPTRVMYLLCFLFRSIG